MCLSKIVMTAGLALSAFRVALGSIVDDDGNRASVLPVPAMGTIFSGPDLTWRAIRRVSPPPA